MAMPGDAMHELLDRLGRNAGPLQQSYANANQLLGAAVTEAFPWVLGLPEVRAKVPPMFRRALPQGSPATLEKIERLATQLLAILAASYAPRGPEPDTAGATDMPRAGRGQANIHTFKDKEQ